MRAAEFLSDVQQTLEKRDEPAYRLGRAYSALTGSLVRGREEAPAAVLDLLAAKDLRGRPAVLSR